MTVPDVGVPLDDLRAALRARIKATSLRKTATEAGLSVGGLSGFLEGKKPQASTLLKVVSWYTRGQHRAARPVSPASARAALVLLTQHLPDGEGEQVRRDLLVAVAKATGRSGMDLPAWIAELLDG